MQERVGKSSDHQAEKVAASPWPEDLRPGEAVLVSACLLGEKTRYDGRHKEDVQLLQKLQNAQVKIISICPEVLGGLSIPRPAAQISHGDGTDVWAGVQTVQTVEKKIDVTDAFMLGAEAVLKIARQCGARYAFLQERSPSCGVLHTHSDGSLRSGPGVASAALASQGLVLISISKKL
jgi:uncharacterized protein YbbK (DUF523 family)